MAVRLAYVVNWESKCGANVQAKRALRYLSDLTGLDITIFHAADVNSPQNFTGEADNGLPIMYPSTVESGLRELDPDIVLVHAFSAELHSRLRELSDELDASWVYRHGTNLAEYWMLQAKARNEDALTELTDRASWFDYIAAPSEQLAERVSLRFGADAPEAAVVPCMADPDGYEPTPFRDTGELRVMLASRIGPIYHHLPVATAVRRLADTHDVTLDMFGGGMEGQAHAMYEVAEGCEALRMHGHKPPQQVKYAMELADVVCVPSVSQCAIPNTAVEALAAGNVVIGGNSAELEACDAIETVPACHDPAWYDELRRVAELNPDAVPRPESVLLHPPEDVVGQGYVPLLEAAADQNIQ